MFANPYPNSRSGRGTGTGKATVGQPTHPRQLGDSGPPHRGRQAGRAPRGSLVSQGKRRSPWRMTSQGPAITNSPLQLRFQFQCGPPRPFDECPNLPDPAPTPPAWPWQPFCLPLHSPPYPPMAPLTCHVPSLTPWLSHPHPIHPILAEPARCCKRG